MLRPIGAQSTAADKIFAGKQKRGPILDAMLFNGRDFFLAALTDFVFGEWASNKTSHFRISPKSHGQRQILVRPAAESEAFCREEVARVRLQSFSPFPLREFGFVILA